MAQTLDQEVEAPLIKASVKGYDDQIAAAETTLTSIKTALVALQVKTAADTDGFPVSNPTDTKATSLIADLTTVLAAWPF